MAMTDPTGHQPAILIVDDDREMAALLRDALDREGFQAEAETRGRDALLASERRRFDVVIVDKEMPDVNGLDLMSEFLRRLPDVRIIFLTAFGGSLVARAARKRGADRYLDKPVRLDDLIATVRAVLSTSRRAG